MFDFFKKDNAEEKDQQASASSQPQAAPGTRVYYHENLIQELVDEHQQLVALYGAIGEANAKGDFAKVSAQLEQFGDMLVGHMLTENIKLYVYLKHVMEDDEENSAMVQHFRSEMQHIGKAVTEFLHKYTGRDWTEGMKTDFSGEFSEVGKVLTHRIQTEESKLYPLYMPPDAY